MSFPVTARSVGLAAVLVAVVAGAGTALATARPAARTTESTAVMVARYSFDQSGTRALIDDSGYGHTLRIVSAQGGKVSSVTHGAGLALQFPKKCSGTCDRVVLQAASAADLNPGNAAFRYGATVRLARSQTSSGQNVLQKGYSATGGQYKLQIDGSAGRPSCVMVDGARTALHLARSSVTVADGGWHQLECRRAGTGLTLFVDGVVRGTASIPDSLSVDNTAPLSIGGKGAYQDNDQFQGAVDDVWITRL
jgi:hypothetical protein